MRTGRMDLRGTFKILIVREVTIALTVAVHE
jgi:hypothetical protein